MKVKRISISLVPLLFFCTFASVVHSADKVVVIPLNTSRDGGSETDPTVNELGKAVLSCAIDQVAKWNGSAWVCADDVDTDTQLTETQVDAYANDNNYLTSYTETDPTVNALSKASLSCDTNQVAKWSGSAWACADDVDTDTQLTESQVDAYANDNNYLTSYTETDPTVNALSKASLSCDTDQVAKWSGSAWSCADDVDTDTQLTESQVDAYADDNGYIELPTQTNNGGKVLTTNGSSPAWTDRVKPDQACVYPSIMYGVDISGNIKCTNLNQKRVFVTSTTYNGYLPGTAGADQKCQTQANAAGLYGEFKAWISDGSNSASSRLSHADVPYVRVDGVTVANNWTDLTDNTLANPINIDENGVNVGSSHVWTGTLFDGSTGISYCDGWIWMDTRNGAAGDSGSTGSSWSYTYFDACSTMNRLYCIEQ